MDRNFGARQLQMLLTLADELHFGRAAEKLGMAQPQLSSAVKRLEEVAGFEIFRRRPVVQLTAGGTVMVDAARRASRDLGQGLEQARAIAAGEDGVIRLGLSGAAMFTELPHALHHFQAANPRCQLLITEGSTGHLVDLLQAGHMDIVVGRAHRAEAPLRSVELMEDQIVLVTASDHALVGKGSVKLKELAEEPFIFFNRSAAPAYHDQIFGACHAGGLTPRVAIEVNTWTATFALVRARFGITFGTEALALTGFPDLSLCEITDAMPEAGFWMSFGVNLAPACSRLVESLQTQLGR